MIQQFLYEVDWGELDYLIIDTPPGTSDEHISLVEFLGDRIKFDGAILVTTPQIVAVNDVRREITFCKKAGLPIIGILENMSYYKCPNCTHCMNIFSSDGGENLAKFAGIKFLNRIPLDSNLSESMEKGDNYVAKFKDSEAAKVLKEVAEYIINSKED